MRVLGIDPGSRRTGYGIIDRHGSKNTAIEFGTIVLGPGPLEGRLRILFEKLTELVITHRPTVVAVEGVFFAKYANSALKLGHARGVALVVASLNDLEVHEYAPKFVKKAVTSSGRAEKSQIQHMVKMLLGLDQSPVEDAADALAIALCHAQNARASVPRPRP
jgi:crossover junction endodeoxyribonuclease RuvC